jgi:K+-transporting ATPase A subunit
MGGNGPYIVFYIVAAVFVATALIGRQISLGKGIKMALAWIAIFAVAIAVFVFLRASGMFQQ